LSHFLRSTSEYLGNATSNSQPDRKGRITYFNPCASQILLFRSSCDLVPTVKCSWRSGFMFPSFIYQRGIRRFAWFVHDAMVHDAYPVRPPVISVRNLVLAIAGMALLASPGGMFAQRGGGRGAVSLGPGGVVGARPDGVSEKDDLKDFHRAMALQATAEQRAAFAKVTSYAEAVSDELKLLRQSSHSESVRKAPAPSPFPDRAAALDAAVEKARASNKNFLASFSTAQKSGLKELTNKLEKSDADLDKQMKILDQIAATPKPETEQIAASAAGLDKEFADFQNEQLALGRQMSILFPAPGENVIFSLPAVTNSINIANQPLVIPVSGALSQTSAVNGDNFFSVKVVADLSDLQQNVPSILRSELDRSPRCGERIAIQEATLTPNEPASLVAIQFHFERWSCPFGSGGAGSTELVEADAEVDIKLTPSVDPKSGLGLISEIDHVKAEGALRNALLSGDLGVMMRERTAAALLSALQKGAGFEAALPSGAHQSASLQKAQFLDTGADQLSLVLDGQLQFSDEQAKQFAAQLKQQLSAQGPSTQ
jgi:hypothetical protein